MFSELDHKSLEGVRSQERTALASHGATPQLIYIERETATMTEQHFEENGFHAASMRRWRLLRPRYFRMS